MSTGPLGSLTDFITGGENNTAEQDLANVLRQIQDIQTPTAQQLHLDPLAQYSVAGELSPALMQASQAGPSAYDSENISSVPMSTMQQALAQEGQIANAQGMTPQERASIAEAEDAVNRDISGQRGAIEQHYAGMGVPQSLIAAALENSSVGQDAQAGYLNALQAQGQAANQGITALQNEGALAGQMYGQQAGQANTVAAAQNALNAFNAQNTQQANVANQANTQAANVYNTETKQNVSNQNVSTGNERQIYNQTQAPVTAAQLALQKGQELSGAGQAQANQATQAGQQAAGLFGSILGAGAQASAGPSTVIHMADGGEISDIRPKVPALNFKAGGPVPGQAAHPGNDPRNDTVPARLSPGEFVVPREAMARPDIRSFLAQNVPTPRPPQAHPSDVASMLKALSMLRAGA